MIKENKKKLLIILLTLLLLIGWFYWFQYRPAKIRSYCDWEANEKATNKKSIYENLMLYSSCLHEKGLIK